MKRAVIPAIAALALITTACGSSAKNSTGRTSGQGPSGSATPSAVTITLANPGVNVTQIPQIAAEQQGFFAKHGLKISEVSFTGGPTEAAALASGSVDVAPLAPAIVGSAAAHGTTLQFFCGVDPAPTVAFLVPTTSGLATQPSQNWMAAFQEMKGKRIGVAATGGAAEIQTAAMLKESGVDPSTVSFVTSGVGPQSTASLLHGQVDVLYGQDFSWEELVANKQARVLVKIGDGSGPALANAFTYGFAASGSWLKSHINEATEFCAAIHDGIDFVQNSANQSAVDNMLESQFNVPSNTVSTARQIVSQFSTNITESSFDEALQLLENSGTLPSGTHLTYAQLVDDVAP